MKKVLFAVCLLSLSLVHASEVNSETACQIAAFEAMLNTTAKAHSLTDDQRTALLLTQLGRAVEQADLSKAFTDALADQCKFLNDTAVELKK